MDERAIMAALGTAAGLAPMLLAACAGRAPEPERGGTREIVAPILMYHHVGALPPDADASLRPWFVSPARLLEHLAALRAAGFETVSCARLAAALRDGEPLPPKPVVITFDDGWKEQREAALPLLVGSGCTATFFVYASGVGGGYMSWDDLRELVAAGMEIGVHSHTHPRLTGVPDAGLEREIVGCRDALEHGLGARLSVFAYPFGDCDARVVARVRESGYACAVGVEEGSVQSATDIFTLRRFRVDERETGEALVRRIAAPAPDQPGGSRRADP